MNILSRGIRNAFRNKIRLVSITAIVGLSVGLALSMLVASSAVADKIASVKASVGNSITVSPAGLRGFEGGGEPLTQDDIGELSKLDHVTSVKTSLSDRLTTDENTDLESGIEAGSLGKRFSQGQSNDSASPSGEAGPKMVILGGPAITLLGTTTPTDLSSTQEGGSLTITDGETIDGTSSEKVALIGKGLAEKNNLSVGSTFKVHDEEVKVAGIFDAGNTFSNNQVIMPLKAVQELTDQEGGVTNASVTVDSVENLSSVTEAIKADLGDDADVTNSSEQAETILSPLENIQTIANYSLVGSITAGAVIVLLMMIMIVRERRREIGVLKAIGASNVAVSLQFMVEAVTLTILSAVLGILIGIAAGAPITSMLVTSSTAQTEGPMRGGPMLIQRGTQAVENIQASVGWDIVFFGLGFAVLIALVGSSLAAFAIAKVRPAEVMRAE